MKAIFKTTFLAAAVVGYIDFERRDDYTEALVGRMRRIAANTRRWDTYAPVLIEHERIADQTYRCTVSTLDYHKSWEALGHTPSVAAQLAFRKYAKDL